MIVCDTGPHYAAADFSDAHHHTCSELLSSLPRPLVVPISVVIETSYLIEHRLGPAAEARFLTELTGGDFEVQQLSPHKTSGERPSLSAATRTYRSGRSTRRCSP